MEGFHYGKRKNRFKDFIKVGYDNKKQFLILYERSAFLGGRVDGGLLMNYPEVLKTNPIIFL